VALELDYVDKKVRSVEFGEGAMPKLELLLLKEDITLGAWVIISPEPQASSAPGS